MKKRGKEESQNYTTSLLGLVAGASGERKDAKLEKNGLISTSEREK